MRNRRLIIIVLSFVCLSLCLYMVSNAVMFKSEYERQTQDQLRELGRIVKIEIEYALGLGIPITSLGDMDRFLGDILKNTPELSSIQLLAEDRVLGQAQNDTEVIQHFTIPVVAQGETVGQIRFGMSDELGKRTLAMLFDLITIVMAGLIITYEIIRFFSSRLIVLPFRQALSQINVMIQELNPCLAVDVPREFGPFVDRIRQRIIIRLEQIHRFRSNLDQVAAIFLSQVFYGRQAFLGELKSWRASLDDLVQSKGHTQTLVDPSQIRPVVFLFFLGANLQASFLPLFSKELLVTPTFLSEIFSNEILMGLPITCYMFTVFLVMLFMGSATFKQWISMDYAIGIGIFFTVSGLIMGGLAQDIVQLIFSRMFGAVGFALIVVYAKQFIVEHTTEKNRALHLAGFTAAFSGGIFCSVIIGSILVEYFSYRFAFFTAAAIVLVIYLFDYMIFSDKVSVTKAEAKVPSSGLKMFFKIGITDLNLICIFIHGIFTRITFIGFFYYSVPVFLKPSFAFADIGRIMMFYSLPSVLLGGFINRRIKRIGQSKASVVGSNILVGAVLVLFPFFTSGPVWGKGVFVIFSLLVLGISNSITFPAQSSLLVNTKTAQILGARTALSVYSSFERIGSSLGPVFFGFFSSCYDITWAIVAGGLLCIAGNLIFLCLFNTNASTEPMLNVDVKGK